MVGSIPLWLHIVGATIWVGSQVMMFAVVVPSVRAAESARARVQVLQGVTRRFGYLGLGALLLLVLTGLDNIDRYSPADMFDVRYGYILATKLVMVGLVVLLTLGHTLSAGPRLLELQRREAEGAELGAEVRSARVTSLLLSVSTLLLSLAILFCAALLQAGWAYEPA